MIASTSAAAGAAKAEEIRMQKMLLIRSRFQATLFLMVAMLAVVASGYAAGNRARAALEDATATAKKWRPDAILTSISSNSVDSEGRGAAWFYSFYSPKARSYLAVTARGRAIDTLELGTGSNVAVPAEFIDSDGAMAEALKAGVKGESLRMRLSRTEWLVNSGDQKGALSVWLNPRTGKLIKRQTVQ